MHVRQPEKIRRQVVRKYFRARGVCVIRDVLVGGCPVFAMLPVLFLESIQLLPWRHSELERCDRLKEVGDRDLPSQVFLDCGEGHENRVQRKYPPFQEVRPSVHFLHVRAFLTVLRVVLWRCFRVCGVFSR